MSRRALWGCLSLTLLMGVAACADRGPGALSTTPAGPPPAPPPVASTAPPAARTPLPDPEADLMQRARDLFQRGERLYREGRLEEAEEYLDRSLRILKDSGLDFYEHPRVETLYFDLQARIRTWELDSLIDPTEMQLPPREPAPLDQIADLNLYTVEVDPKLKEIVGKDLLNTRFDIPMVLNDRVVRFLNYYQTRGRPVMEEGLRRAGRYLELFRRIFREEGVPQDLVYMAQVESLFKPHAYSRARAKGIWQFLRSTGRLYGLRQDWWIDERADILRSTRAAARHLKDLYQRFQDWHLALAAYNGGARRIQRNLARYGRMDYWTMARRRKLPRETRNYVPSILASIIIFRNPERYGFQVRPAPPLRFETVPLSEQVDLTVAAELLGVPLGELLDLNPELRRGITPLNDPDYRLKVPAGQASLLLERLASLPAEKKVHYRHHRVRRGETLSVIARRYSSSITAIAQVNRIRNVHRLRQGQDLLIPLSSKRRWSRRLPLPTTHVVRRGESLFRIARRYGVALGDLLRWNHLGPDAVIHPGQRLRIGEKRARAAGGTAQR